MFGSYDWLNNIIFKAQIKYRSGLLMASGTASWPELSENNAFTWNIILRHCFSTGGSQSNSRSRDFFDVVAALWAIFEFEYYEIYVYI